MSDIRVGHGFDVHAFAENRKLIIGGVDIPYDLGLAGHSDADVLLHAICDALLGAAGLGDIGRHFPDTDAAFAGIDSRILLRRVAEQLQARNWRVGNVDATIIAQAPKMAPHIARMTAHIADDLGIALDRVNVKATTTEKLGFTGRGEGIAAEAVCLIGRDWRPNEAGRASPARPSPTPCGCSSPCGRTTPPATPSTAPANGCTSTGAAGGCAPTPCTSPWPFSAARRPINWMSWPPVPMRSRPMHSSCILDQAGYWRHNRIGWLGASETPPQHVELVGALNAALQEAGFPVDARPHVPHVTLLRKSAGGEVPECMPVHWPINDFVLVKSGTESDGAHYEVIRRWPFDMNQHEKKPRRLDSGVTFRL